MLGASTIFWKDIMMKVHRQNAREYYETSDGAFFNDRAEAERHESNVEQNANPMAFYANGGQLYIPPATSRINSTEDALRRDNQYLSDKIEVLAKAREQLAQQVDRLREGNTALHDGAIEESQKRKQAEELAEGLRGQVEAWQEATEEANAEVFKLNGYLKRIYEWLHDPHHPIASRGNSDDISRLKDVLEKWSRGDLP